MGNLVYVSYGSGPHVQEVRFSILSALRFRGGWPSDDRLLIYTDTPADFQGLGATIHPLTPEQLAAWTGPGGYHYRRKIVVLSTALRTYDGPSVLVDGDTYFLKPPGTLFSRIKPGQSLMHLLEGRTGSLDVLKPMSFVGKSFALNGETFEAGGDLPMWNSGVVGVHPADVGAVDQTAELCDVLQRESPSRISEQLAFAMVLGRRTRIVGCRDVVYHYYAKELRRPLHAALPRLVEQHRHLPLSEQARALYRHRPATSPRVQLKQAIKRAARPFGFFAHDFDRSF